MTQSCPFVQPVRQWGQAADTRRAGPVTDDPQGTHPTHPHEWLSASRLTNCCGTSSPSPRPAACRYLSQVSVLPVSLSPSQLFLSSLHLNHLMKARQVWFTCGQPLGRHHYSESRKVFSSDPISGLTLFSMHVTPVPRLGSWVFFSVSPSSSFPFSLVQNTM